MGTPLGPKYIPYTYMDPLGREVYDSVSCSGQRAQPEGASAGPLWGRGG